MHFRRYTELVLSCELRGFSLACGLCKGWQELKGLNDKWDKMGSYLLELFVELLESFHSLDQQISVIYWPFEASNSLTKLTLDVVSFSEHLVVRESRWLSIGLILVKISSIGLVELLVSRMFIPVWTSPSILSNLRLRLICEEICQFHPIQLGFLLQSLLLFEILGRFLSLFLLSLLLEPFLFLLLAFFFLLYSFALLSSFSFNSLLLFLSLFFKSLLLFDSFLFLALTLLGLFLFSTLLVLLLLLLKHR